MSNWIPCKERLPEEDGEYLVSVKRENGTCTTSDFYHSGEGWCAEFLGFEVIAWMLPPKAYEEI